MIDSKIYKANNSSANIGLSVIIQQFLNSNLMAPRYTTLRDIPSNKLLSERNLFSYRNTNLGCEIVL